MWQLYVTVTELRTTKLKKLFSWIRNPWKGAKLMQPDIYQVRGPYKSYEEVMYDLHTITEWCTIGGCHVAWFSTISKNYYPAATTYWFSGESMYTYHASIEYIPEGVFN